jgi:glycosyltransferase involved in cell wall biosynthesis
MKVLLISHQFPSAEIAYRGRFVEDQILATQSFGVEFFVLQVEPEGLRPGNIRNFLMAIWFGFFLGRSKPILVAGKESGVRLYSPGIRLGGGVQAVVNSMIAARWMVGKGLLQTFNCIHAHTGLSDGWIAFVLSRIAGGRPYMITEHTGPYEMLFKGIGASSIVRFVARKARAVVAVSSFLKAVVVRRFPDLKVEVVANTYDPASFRGSDVLPEFGRHKIVWIGQISPGKRLGLAVASLAELRKTGLNAELRVLTSSKLERETEDFIDREGLREFVSIFRAEDRNEVATELRQAASLLVTSAFETFSVTTLEALASGVPVVSTDCGGPRDLITQESDGFVDPIGSPVSLAAALHNQIENDTAERRKVRSRHAATKFGPSAIGAWYSNKYREISEQA